MGGRAAVGGGALGTEGMTGAGVARALVRVAVICCNFTISCVSSGGGWLVTEDWERRLSANLYVAVSKWALKASLSLDSCLRGSFFLPLVRAKSG